MRNLALFVSLTLGFALGWAEGRDGTTNNVSSHSEVGRTAQTFAAQTAVLREIKGGSADLLAPIASETLNRRKSAEQKIPSLFGKGATGDKLREAALLLSAAKRDRAAGARFEKALQALRETPEATLEELKSGLREFPLELEAEREFFIQFAARLDTEEDKKLELFKSELNRPVIGGDENTQRAGILASIITMDSLLEAASSADAVDEVVIPLWKGQPRSAALDLLLQRYAAKYPDRSTALEKQLGY